MEETRKYISKTLESQVRQENELASLAVESWARHKGWVKEETPEGEESQIEIVDSQEGFGAVEEEDLILSKDLESMSGESVKGFECGLYAVAASIFFLAIVYLGVYVHSVVSIEETSVERYSSGFYHYESEHIPYHGEDIPFERIPYELENYLFRQMMGF